MPIIEAQHYADEAERLANDPAIIALAEAIPEEHRAGFLTDAPGHEDDMSKAYHVASRLGVSFDSIGGPARAIRLVLDRLSTTTTEA